MYLYPKNLNLKKLRAAAGPSGNQQPTRPERRKMQDPGMGSHRRKQIRSGNKSDPDKKVVLYKCGKW